MQLRRLRGNGRAVSELGVGCMPMSSRTPMPAAHACGDEKKIEDSAKVERVLDYALRLALQIRFAGWTHRFAQTQATTRGAKRRASQLIAFLIGFSAMPPMSSDAIGATIRARYAVWYLGMEVGELALVSTIGRSSYEAGLDAHLTGIATVATSYKISMKTDGLVRNGAIVPSSFFFSQTGTDQPRTMRVSLVSGNARSAEINPPFENVTERVPVTEEHKRNVVDPLSALILTMPPDNRETGPSACNRTLRVFTGSVRADVELTYVRTEKFKTKGYSGPVAVCSARYVPLAGHNPNATMAKFMMANGGIEVRLAPIQDTTLMLLVSAKVPMPLGRSSVELSEYKAEPNPERPGK